jgi:uncharacterized membrane protein
MSQQQRFWEIDFLRGIAIMMMMLFHALYDINYFGVYSVILSSGFWRVFAHITAGIFIFIFGVSLTISHSRAIAANKTKRQLQLKCIKRGLKIFSLGLLITLMTYAFLRDGFIIFGILHLIGASVILAYPFIKYRLQNLVLGIMLLALGFCLGGLTFSFPWLLWLGLKPAGFYTLDYFPVLPWFGVALLGLFAGNTLYGNGKRRFRFPEPGKTRPVGFFCLLGRHSLLIYLLHQPVLIAFLHVFVL